MGLNKILTASNLRLKITNLFGGKVAPHDTLDGVPLGTSNDSETGEIAVKVLMVGQSVGANSGSGMPYGATQQEISNVAAGPSVITYKNANGDTLTTRSFTYTNGGASNTDVLTNIVDT